MPEFADITKGSILDFWVAALTAFMIMLIRYVINWKFQTKMLSFMSEQRFKDKADALKRAEQHCKWMFDVVYYTCITIIGYLIIRKTDFLPNYLGGSGSCSNIYVGHPKVQDIKFLNLYYQIQAGSHLYTFINQIWCKRNDTKFYEYALHHGLALFLIWFSYMMNLT